jgi:phosphoribosylformimino-5-aminoimidazole carboxamide ribotide isomerase
VEAVSDVRVQTFTAAIKNFAESLDADTKSNALDLFLLLGKTLPSPDFIERGLWPTICFIWRQGVEVEIFEDSYEFYKHYDGASDIVEFMHLPGEQIPIEFLTKLDSNLNLRNRPKILFPAIDLKDGQCVRLKLGEMDSATVYNDDPAAQAKAFEDQGFQWLHVVDLNGAFEGQSVNGVAVEAILEATKNPVQLGGGIRTLAHIESWLDKGLARVILGTVAVRDPDLVKEACRLFPGKVAVGIDAKGGFVAVEGWAEASTLGVTELAKQFEGAGVAAIIYTDIDRDGVLAGINWPSTIALADAVSIPVIASGGLASMDDIRRMTMPDAAKLEGAISGRALYDGRIDPKEALAVLKGEK